MLVVNTLLPETVEAVVGSRRALWYSLDTAEVHDPRFDVPVLHKRSIPTTIFG